MLKVRALVPVDLLTEDASNMGRVEAFKRSMKAPNNGWMTLHTHQVEELICPAFEAILLKQKVVKSQSPRAIIGFEVEEGVDDHHAGYTMGMSGGEADAGPRPF